VLTVGIDLAAEAARSAMAVIRWEKTVAVIEQLALGATDRMLVEAACPADKVGIDCPLGWPVAFVDFVQRHARGDIRPGEGRDIEARLPLAYRRTDLAVVHAGGPIPLSVSSDRIGRAAMRAAGLLSVLAKPGEPVDPVRPWPGGRGLPGGGAAAVGISIAALQGPTECRNTTDPRRSSS
jgi:predicted nuclease with RNAse H fold